MELSRSELCALLGLSLLCGLFLQGCGGGSSPSSSTKMPSLKLQNGVEMPIMSVGTWQYNDTTAEIAVKEAFANGFTHIDTAYDYHNQAGVAKGLRHVMAKGTARTDIFVTTKVPGCGSQNVSSLSAENCRRDTAARLADDVRLLNLTYIDLVLVHFPPCPGNDGSIPIPLNTSCFAAKSGCSSSNSCDMVRAQWSAVMEAYNKKQFRAVGVSNYCKQCMKCLENMSNVTVMPMINQAHYQVGMGPDPQGFKSTAEKKGMVFQAYSPLGSGGHGSSSIMTGNLTTAIAKKYGKSSVQIALKWIVSKNLAVVTKSSNPAHLAENADIFDFELSDEDALELDKADFAAKDDPSFMCTDEPVREKSLRTTIV